MSDQRQARECEYRCVTAADVGLPEVGGMVDIDPGCPVHDVTIGAIEIRPAYEADGSVYDEPPGDTGMKVGDRVIAFDPNGFGARAVVDIVEIDGDRYTVRFDDGKTREMRSGDLAVQS